jgi:2-polyprenyl-6-methoxyphenol hydroxylase-like FAD-dependent oxidoreductase
MPPSSIASVNVPYHEIQLPHAAPGGYGHAMAEEEETPVLIVGGSLVGLTTAMLLGHHGVASLSIERHAGTAIHPRAGHFQLRTLEILRQVGLEDRVRAKSLETYSASGGINAVESLAGAEIATYVKELNEGVEGFSPTVRVFINQDVLEPLLRERALELGARVRNRVEVVSLAQDDDGVTATLRDLDGGGEETVRARYVVAADGNRSPTREQLGIAMEGYGELSRSITVYFNADCSELIRDRNQGVIYVHNPQLRGFFRLDRSGGTGFLVINTVGEDVTTPEAIDVQSGLTEERTRELLRAAIGADIPIEIVDVAHWRAEANCAQRFRDGRVFLAGDAAHVVPPNGGYGGNTGVQDAHNLAWKLAAVIRGQAGAALLDSYEAERRPLGELTVRQAYNRYATRVVPERGSEGVDPFVPDIELEIGGVVRSAAVLGEDGGDDGALHMNPSQTRGRPGTRAPHVTMPDGSSTLDRFGGEFVLVHGGDAAVPCGLAACELEAAALDAYGIGPAGGVLVRPDGIVAWRAHGAHSGDAVGAALRAVLGL